MTDVTKDEWYLSLRGEHFNVGPYPSADAAIAAAPEEFRLAPGRAFHVGKRGPAPHIWIDAESILDDLRTDMADQVGSDLATEEFDADQAQYDELGEALNRALREWMDRHGLHLRCWTIEDKQRHVYEPVAEPAPARGGV